MLACSTRPGLLQPPQPQRRPRSARRLPGSGLRPAPLALSGERDGGDRESVSWRRGPSAAPTPGTPSRCRRWIRSLRDPTTRRMCSTPACSARSSRKAMVREPVEASLSLSPSPRMLSRPCCSATRASSISSTPPPAWPRATSADHSRAPARAVGPARLACSRTKSGGQRDDVRVARGRRRRRRALLPKIGITRVKGIATARCRASDTRRTTRRRAE